MKIKIIVLLILTIIIGCTSTKEVMNSWMGLTKQKLILSWGPPTKSSSDGAGGEVIVYVKQIHLPAQTFYYAGGSSTTPAKNYWDYKMFWVNPEGILYHWKTQRLQIPPRQIDLTIYHK